MKERYLVSAPYSNETFYLLHNMIDANRLEEYCATDFFREGICAGLHLSSEDILFLRLAIRDVMILYVGE